MFVDRPFRLGLVKINLCAGCYLAHWSTKHHSQQDRHRFIEELQVAGVTVSPASVLELITALPATDVQNLSHVHGVAAFSPLCGSADLSKGVSVVRQSGLAAGFNRRMEILYHFCQVLASKKRNGWKMLNYSVAVSQSLMARCLLAQLSPRRCCRKVR